MKEQNLPSASPISELVDSAPPSGTEDSRWDQQKALTLGTVLQELGGVDEALAVRRQAEEARVEKKDRELDRLYEGYSDIVRTGSREESEKALERFDSFANAAEPESVRHKDLQFINERIDWRMAPYEALYDLNPTVFSQLPTAEFMAEAHKLEHITSEIARLNDCVRWFPIFEGDFATAFEKNIWDDTVRGTMDANAGLLKRFLFHTQGVDREAEVKFDREYHSISASNEKPSPRQLLESHQAFIQKYVAILEQRRTSFERQRDIFFEEYGVRLHPD